MENIDKITKKISEKSDAEADEILKEARVRADEIISEAQKKASEIKMEIVEKGERDSERERQRIIANAKLQSRKARLEAKEDVIREAFERAEGELKKVTRSNKYPSVLASLIKEAQGVIGGDVEVLVRKDDLGILTKEYLNKLSDDTKSRVELSQDYIDTVGGAMVRSKDGKVEVNNTIEMRRERMRGELRPKVAQTLFSEV